VMICRDVFPSVTEAGAEFVPMLVVVVAENVRLVLEEDGSFNFVSPTG